MVLSTTSRHSLLLSKSTAGVHVVPLVEGLERDSMILLIRFSASSTASTRGREREVHKGKVQRNL